jgi:hypothetical protein
MNITTNMTMNAVIQAIAAQVCECCS